MILAITLILLVLWTLIPFYSLITTSIAGTSTKLAFPHVFDLSAYREIFSPVSPDFIVPYILNSCIVTGGAIMIVLIVSLPAAYSLSRMKSRGGKVAYLSVYMLRMIPPIALVVPWYFIIMRSGLYDTRIGLMIAEVPLVIPIAIWLMKGFYDVIPQEMEEAAWIDGATTLQTLTKVILPLSLQGIVVVIIFCFVMIFNEYLYAMTLSETTAVTVPVFIAGFTTEHKVEFQKMMSAGLISILPVIILYLFAQKYMVRGIIVGAGK